jgi:hypothetical protein
MTTSILSAALSAEDIKVLDAFVVSVILTEAENCARICENLGKGLAKDEVSAQECADAIRKSRGLLAKEIPECG